MQYKRFGKTGISMSTLGFGAMRLPTHEVNGKKIVDYDLAVPMMQHAFDLGVNYVDTAPFYCESDSETAVGMALKGYRSKVCVSTKCPSDIGDPDEWMRMLEGSLKKLDVDHIDFYHQWGTSLEDFNTKVEGPNGVHKAAQKALDQGLIKHWSFSFHDDPKNMIPIIDSGYFSSVLCQYNLLDRSNEESIAYAQSKGLGVVIMGPVAGGRLGAPSDIIKNMLKREVQSTAEMALRYVLANPNVNIALSGMETMAMVDENAKVASIEGHLTEEELAQVATMMQENKKLADLYCTGCKYCMPCPQGINIPHIFSLMNYHKVYGLTDHAKKQYGRLSIQMDQRNRFEKNNGFSAAVCAECGQCENQCPQHLKIMQQLRETHGVLGA